MYEDVSGTRRLYVGYLRTLPWTHICTLTFRNNVSSGTAWNSFKSWIQTHEKASSRPVEWFAVVEGGGHTRRHVHAILNTPPTIRSFDLRSQWKAGFSHVENFDTARRGVEYVTKSLDRSDADYDMVLNPEPMRNKTEKNDCKERQETSVALMTVPEVAKRLKVSDARCYDLIRKNILPAVSLGRQKRVSERVLARFIRRGGKKLEASD